MTESGDSPRSHVVLRIAEFTIDLQRHALFRSNERIHLTPKPFEVLAYLAQARGRVVSKAELLKIVWEGSHDENAVEQAVRQIRRALGEEKSAPRFIQTLSGQGYFFVGAVEEVEEELIPGNTEAVGSDPLPPTPRSHTRIAIVLSALALLVGSAILVRLTVPEPRLTNPTRITRLQSRILSPILIGGARLFYQRFDNGRYTLAEVAAEGGETARVEAGVSNPELCDIAPDGHSLLIRDLTRSRENDEPVYIQPIHGIPARRVGDILAYDAAWDPDGSRIFYTSGGTFYATDSAGKSKRRLFSAPGNAYWLRWSPDRKRLRFTVIDRKTEAASIWQVDAPFTGNPHPLFPRWKGPAQQCCGAWTPDGNDFVFQVRTGNIFHIYARREANGLLRGAGPPVALTAGPINYRGPVIGRDGRKVFVRTEVLKGEIVRFDRASRQYIPMLPGVSARTAAFSPDGQWIAYSSLTENNLWRCRGTGGGCAQVTEGLQQAVMPRWSPDGKRIAFMGRHFSKGWEVFLINADGSQLQSLSSGNRTEGDPDWSPDGSRLVYGNVMETPTNMAIHVMTLPARSVSTLPGSAGRYSPRWSPDGRYIVAIRADGRGLDIFEWASGKWSSLTQLSAAFPNWSHDSAYVYFYSAAGGERTVFRVAITRRSVEPVASLASVEQGPFLMGSWIGLTPDDAPMAVRDLTIEDIYSWDFSPG